jgi:hypothetical protein
LFTSSSYRCILTLSSNNGVTAMRAYHYTTLQRVPFIMQSNQLIPGRIDGLLWVTTSPKPDRTASISGSNPHHIVRFTVDCPLIANWKAHVGKHAKGLLHVAKAEGVDYKKWYVSRKPQNWIAVERFDGTKWVPLEITILQVQESGFVFQVGSETWLTKRHEHSPGIYGYAMKAM